MTLFSVVPHTADSKRQAADSLLNSGYIKCARKFDFQLALFFQLWITRKPKCSPVVAFLRDWIPAPLGRRATVVLLPKGALSPQKLCVGRGNPAPDISVVLIWFLSPSVLTRYAERRGAFSLPRLASDFPHRPLPLWAGRVRATCGPQRWHWSTWEKPGAALARGTWGSGQPRPSPTCTQYPSPA